MVFRMPKVPKKPNKRRKKTSAKQLPEPKSMTVQEIQYQRFIQATSIREQIKANVGDIFTDIPQFETHLSAWASTGRDLTGKCEIPRIGKEMEWRFHSDIKKYPEVWFREIV
jgi:hypothetical protein